MGSITCVLIAWYINVDCIQSTNWNLEYIFEQHMPCNNVEELLVSTCFQNFSMLLATTSAVDTSLGQLYLFRLVKVLSIQYLFRAHFHSTATNGQHASELSG